MKKEVGLWIDHRKAVIVSITNGVEVITSVESELDKHVRFSGGAQKVSEEDQRDRRFANHMNKYYDEVIALIRDAESILIIGPGEAKVEFHTRIERDSQIGKVVGLETVDKMTDAQIAVKIREYFLK